MRLVKYALGNKVVLLVFIHTAQVKIELTSVLLEELIEAGSTFITKMETPFKQLLVTESVIIQDEVVLKGYRRLIGALKNITGIHIANLASSEDAVTKIYADNNATVSAGGIKIKFPFDGPGSTPLLGDGGSLLCIQHRI